MAGPVLVQSPSMKSRLTSEEGRANNNNNNNNNRGKKFGEVAGGTTAECAAVCCCGPCLVVDLLVLAVYKVPAGLCKKAWTKQRKRQRAARRKQVGGLLMAPAPTGDDGAQKQELLVAAEAEKNEKAAELELEKEMWDQFRGTGFWRSPSQAES